jgi:hypothetical protein
MGCNLVLALSLQYNDWNFVLRRTLKSPCTGAAKMEAAARRSPNATSRKEHIISSTWENSERIVRYFPTQDLRSCKFKFTPRIRTLLLFLVHFKSCQPIASVAGKNFTTQPGF